MSSIDRRVVSIEMDDQQFQRAANNTMATLGKLEESMQFNGSSNGIDEFQRSLNNVNFDALNSALDKVNDGFSFLGIMAKRTIEDITDSIYSFVRSGVTGMWNKTIGQIYSGGWNRANNIASATHMLKGMGYEISQIEGSINHAVQDTAYGYDEAARIGSQFLASGVQIGEEMDTALRAVSGAAAMTGASYAEIGDIFAKVAGQGKVMALDLNRFAVRGLNAAATIADYYGITEAELRAAVTAGEVGFMDLAEAMDAAFGEHATAANETYSGSLANINAALSRIGEQFVSPYMKAMTPFFNNLRIMVKGIEKTMKPISAAIVPIYDSIWGESGVLSRMADTATRRIFARWISDKDLKSMEYTEEEIAEIRAQVGEQQDFPLQTAIESIIEKITAFLEEYDVDAFFDKLEAAADWVRGFIDPFITYFQEFKSWFDSIKDDVKGFFDGFFEPVMERLKNFFSFPVPSWLQDSAETVSGVVKDLEELLGIHREDVDSIIRGDYGNGQDRVKNLFAANKNYWELQDLVNYVLNGTTTSLSELSDEELINLGYTQDQIDAMRQLYPEVEKTASALETLAEIANQVIRGDFGNGADRYNALTEAGKNYWEIQDKVNEIMGVDIEKLHKMSDEQLLSLGYTQEQIDAMRALYAAMEEAEMEQRFGGLWGFISGLRNVVVFLLDTWETFKQALADVLFERQPIQFLYNAFANIGSAIAKVTEYLGGENTQSVLYGLFHGILLVIADIIYLISDSITTMASPFANAIIGVIDVVNVLLKHLGNLFGFLENADGLSAFDILRGIVQSIADIIAMLFNIISFSLTWLSEKLDDFFTNSPFIQFLGSATSSIFDFIGALFASKDAVDETSTAMKGIIPETSFPTLIEPEMTPGEEQWRKLMKNPFGANYSNKLTKWINDFRNMLPAFLYPDSIYWDTYSRDWRKSSAKLPQWWKDLFGLDSEGQKITFIEGDQIPLGRQFLDVLHDIGDWWTKFNDKFKTVDETTGEKKGGFFFTLLGKLWDFAGFVGRAGAGVIQFLGGLIDTISKSKGWHDFIEVLKSIGTTIAGWAGGIWDKIYTLFFGKKEGETAIEGAVNGIKKIDFAKIGNDVGSILGGALEWISGLLDNIHKKIINVVDAFKTFFDKDRIILYDENGNKMPSDNKFLNFLDNMKERYDKIKEWLDKHGVIDAFRKFFSDLADIFNRLNPFTENAKFTEDGIPIVPSFQKPGQTGNAILDFLYNVKVRFNAAKEAILGFLGIAEKADGDNITSFFVLDDNGKRTGILGFFDSLKEKLQGIGQWIIDRKNDVLGFFSTLLTSIFGEERAESLKNKLKGFSSAFTDFFGAIWEVITTFFSKDKNVKNEDGITPMQEATDNLTSKWEILKGKILGLWDKVTGFVLDIKEKITSFSPVEAVRGLLDKMVSFLEKLDVFGLFSETFEKLHERIANADLGTQMKGMGGGISGLFSTIFSGDENEKQGLIDKIKANPIVAALIEAINAIIKSVEELIPSLRESLGGLGDALFETLGNIFTKPLEGGEDGETRFKTLSEFFEPLINFFSGKGEGTSIEGAAKDAEDTGSFLSNAVKSINGAIESFFGLNGEGFPTNTEGGPTGLLGIIRDIEHFIAEVVDNDDVKRIMNAIQAGAMAIVWVGIASVINSIRSIAAGLRRIMTMKVINAFSLFAMNNLFKLILAVITFMAAALVIGNLDGNGMWALAKGLGVMFAVMAGIFYAVQKYAKSVKDTGLIDGLKVIGLLMTAMIPFVIGLFAFIKLIEWVTKDTKRILILGGFIVFIGLVFAAVFLMAKHMAKLKKEKGIDIGDQMQKLGESMESIAKAFVGIAKAVAIFAAISAIVGFLPLGKVLVGLFAVTAILGVMVLVTWAFSKILRSNQESHLEVSAFETLEGIFKGMAILLGTLAVIAGIVSLMASKGTDFKPGLRVLGWLAAGIVVMIAAFAAINRFIGSAGLFGGGGGSDKKAGTVEKVFTFIGILAAIWALFQVIQTMSQMSGKTSGADLWFLIIALGGISILLGAIKLLSSVNPVVFLGVMGVLAALWVVLNMIFDYITQWKKIDLAKQLLSEGGLAGLDEALIKATELTDRVTAVGDGLATAVGDVGTAYGDAVDNLSTTMTEKTEENKNLFAQVWDWLGGTEVNAAELDAPIEEYIEKLDQVPNYLSEEYIPSAEDARNAMMDIGNVDIDMSSVEEDFGSFDGMMGNITGNLEGYIGSAEGMLSGLLGEGGISELLGGLGLDGSFGEKINGLLEKLETFNLESVFENINLTEKLEGALDLSKIDLSKLNLDGLLDKVFGKENEGNLLERLSTFGSEITKKITSDDGIIANGKKLISELLRSIFGDNAILNEEGRVDLVASMSNTLKHIIASVFNLDENASLKDVLEQAGKALGDALSESFSKWFCDLSIVKFVRDIPTAFGALPDLFKAIFTGEGLNEAYEDNWNSNLDIAYVTQTANDYAIAKNISKEDQDSYVNAVLALVAGGEEDINAALATAMELYGKNAVEGFATGISDNSNEVVGPIQELATTANETLETEMDMHSPSRVWQDYGNNLIEGLLIPFNSTSKQREVISAVSMLIKKMNTTASGKKEIFKQTGNQLVNALIDEFVAKGDPMIGQTVAMNILQGFSSQNQNAYNAGQTFVNMLAFGIINSVSVLQNAAAFAADQMVQAFVNARDAAAYANGIQNGTIIANTGIQNTSYDTISGIYPKANLDYTTNLATITRDLTDATIAAKNSSVNVYNDSNVVSAIGGLQGDIKDLKNAMSSMGVYLDGKVLTGRLASGIDRSLGYTQNMQRRGAL